MKDLGASLKKRREELNISMEELQEKTKIRKLYLMAIERGQEDVLPGEVYLKGFLRSYAQAVGLDVDEVMGQYKRSRKVELEEEKEELEERLKEGGTGIAPITIHLLIILAIIAIVLFSIFYIFTQKNDQEDLQMNLDHQTVVEEHQDELLSEEDRDEFVTEERTVEVDSFFLTFLRNDFLGHRFRGFLKEDGSEEVDTPLPMEEIEQVVVKIRSIERSWIRVQSNGQILFQGFLEEGDEMTFQGEQELTFRVGNAGGILMKDDLGKYTIPFGARGEVKDLLFTLGDDNP